MRFKRGVPIKFFFFSEQNQEIKRICWLKCRLPISCLVVIGWREWPLGVWLTAIERCIDWEERKMPLAAGSRLVRRGNGRRWPVPDGSWRKDEQNADEEATRRSAATPVALKQGKRKAVVKIANVSTPANFVKGKTLLKVRAIIPVSEISSSNVEEFTLFCALTM